MSRPVSIVIPACEGTTKFAAHIRPLLHEAALRDLKDEVIVVDDTGIGSHRRWIRKDFPAVAGITHTQARGYGRALLSGAMAAKHDLVLCLAPDVCAREGFLTPLVECLDDEGVFAASPRVMVEGDTRDHTPTGSLFTPAAENAFVPELKQLGVLDERAFLIRKQDLGGAALADLYEPACVDPGDLCRHAARRSARMVRVEASQVDWHTVQGDQQDRDRLIDLARDRNHLLSYWLHVDDAEARREHLKQLWHELLGVTDRSSAEDLRTLVHALERVSELSEARRALSATTAAPSTSDHRSAS